ncbi:TetR family transcriptional regulator [Streptomyces sp. Act143]|uniref:TetR/AcrR family transcriptional regulator n=1 Tax=Streptomyces sp. Act143 TaxID=2200760 RepID=UPI000D675DF4|nr:TetR/AcrR family transcriptional regulator [Streptomyces sp. Act143]PWI19367.1 TetR family transcriptional regulator [Streptomyces sp. Act143]
MGRTSDAKNKILTAAHSLIEQRGYSALGVAEICKSAGVPKGSFYYFFESKETLALAVIDEHWAAERREWECALEGDVGPVQRLQRLFESMETQQRAGQDSCGSVVGCMFGNLSLEMSVQADAVRERLQGIFEAQVDLVTAVVAEAQESGEVTVADARAVARSMVAQAEGQVLFAKLHNDPSQLSTLWTSCRALLGVPEPQVPAHA